MSHILVAFSHDKFDWISRAMAWATFGEQTHCALVKGDRVIEASAVGEPKGVRPVTLDTFLAKHPSAVIRKIDHLYPDLVWEHAASRIGCDYDWDWIKGYLARRRDWQDPSKFTCQELITWACDMAGDPLFAGDNNWHVTPQMLFMISKD